MSIKISIQVVENTYALLRSTKPFSSWKLQEFDDIGFSVTRDRINRGEFQVKNGVPFICVSEVCHHTLDELIRTVAHEMCHLCDWNSGVRPDVVHGWTFNKMADSVCKFHNFDRGAF